MMNELGPHGRAADRRPASWSPSSWCSACSAALLGAAIFKKRRPDRHAPGRRSSAVTRPPGIALDLARRHRRRFDAVSSRKHRDLRALRTARSRRRRRRAPMTSAIYDARRRRSRSLLGRLGARARVDQAVGHGARVEAARREVVRRRQAQRQRQLRRPPRAQRAPQQGRDHLGRRARRPPHAHLLGSLSRGEPVRERAEGPRRQARRPRRDLPAADPRAGDRDARVRAHRRDPLRRVRRLQRGVAARPHQRLAGDAARHRRRRLPPRIDRPAQADGRRGAAEPRRRSRTSSSCSATRRPLPGPHRRKDATTGITA